MAKKTIAKVNPVTDALRKLKEEELELLSKLKPVQEAISALENILDKPTKKASSSPGVKDDHLMAEESAGEQREAFQ
jgi:hypothetical protein